MKIVGPCLQDGNIVGQKKPKRPVCPKIEIKATTRSTKQYRQVISVELQNALLMVKGTLIK